MFSQNYLEFFHVSSTWIWMVNSKVWFISGDYGSVRLGAGFFYCYQMWFMHTRWNNNYTQASHRSTSSTIKYNTFFNPGPNDSDSFFIVLCKNVQQIAFTALQWTGLLYAYSLQHWGVCQPWWYNATLLRAQCLCKIKLTQWLISICIFAFWLLSIQSRHKWYHTANTARYPCYGMPSL